MNWSLKALGTVWFFNIKDNSSEQQLQNFKLEIEQEIQDFEAKYSRFKENSLVNYLNKNKRLVAPPRDLIEMLDLGQKLFENTKGNFSLFLGKKQVKNGYGKDFSLTNTDYEFNSNFLRDKLFELEKKPNQKILHLKKDVLLDLGSVGKGFLVDKIASKFKKKAFKKFYINAGGDIYSSCKKVFYLESPFCENQYFQKIELEDQSLASSGAFKRIWKYKNQIKTHIINFNPNLKSVYILSKKCFVADSLATAFLVSDLESHKKLAKTFEFEFLLIFKNKKIFKSKAFNSQ